ncbi:hypothetical protein EOE67_14035 [Rheinheimera riviphila]|uniref:Uncharacterized protein n=1 Tax=Rheinheimera riviphila TaxID=1834037 RepID=A0A437QLT6_9GAMM|nr:hypothetical protein [Rheinheimera riviphila]RVU35486.1 hypothetical protein EOE67_14035 [Rheinheimera riviphila]
MHKKEGKFLSTNTVNSKESIQLGLVKTINVGVRDGHGGESKYWPLCDDRYFPSKGSKRYLDFNAWWEEVVFLTPNASLTRQDLVLQMANKDGGAHVDAKVEEKYDRFRNSWVAGSSLVGIKSGTVRGYDNIPTYPAIRQIAFELLASLQP